MSLFSDTVDQVYTLTNRSDLVAETALAVRQATAAAHRSDFYPRDLQELQLNLSSTANFQLAISSYFPNWRSFSYIRPFTVLTGSLASFILGPNEELAPDAIFDEYLVEKKNVWYVGGDNLNIRLEGAYDGLVVGYYKNPILSPDGSYNSWIAQEPNFSAVIILEAAIKVFRMIGYEEQAAALYRFLYDAPRDVPSEFQRFRAAALHSGAR